MAATFNSVYDSLMGSVTPTDYSGMFESAINPIIDANTNYPTMKKGKSRTITGLNGEYGTAVNEGLNQASLISRQLAEQIKMYDSLLEKNNTKTKFISSLEEGGYTPSKDMRKNIGTHYENYINKIQEAKQASINSYNENLGMFDEMFEEMTGRTTRDTRKIFEHRNKRANNFDSVFDGYKQELDMFTNNFSENINDINKEIVRTTDSVSDQLKKAKSQSDVNDIFNNYKDWAKKMQNGAEDATSSNMVSAYNELLNKKNSMLEVAKKNGHYEKDMADKINSMFDEATEGYASVLGESGALNQSVVGNSVERKNAINRVIDPEFNPEKPGRRKGASIKAKEAEKIAVGKKDISKSPWRESFSERAKPYLNPFREVEQVPMRNEAKAMATEAAEKVTKEAAEDLAETSVAKKLLKRHGFNSIINGVFTIADYKESRREGDGILKSATKAGANFVIGETLGLAAVPFYLASSLPSMAIKGVEGVAKMNREMNSASRMQPFSDVHFQDTQQLSTMRQSGMEMAKMSQYNLQQTIMGNEAQYLK